MKKFYCVRIKLIANVDFSWWRYVFDTREKRELFISKKLERDNYRIDRYTVSVKDPDKISEYEWRLYDGEVALYKLTHA